MKASDLSFPIKKSWVALGAMNAIREKIEEDEEILLDFEFIIDNQLGEPMDVTFKFTFKEDSFDG